MVDDLSLLVGEIRGATRAISERLDRQDRETDEKFRSLAEQHESDKRAAIAARAAKEARDDQKHEETKTEMRKMREAIDSTALIAQDNKRWIDNEGRPLAKRIGAIEQGKVVDAAETRGRKAAFGLVYVAIGSGLTALGALLGGDRLEAVRSFFHHG